ncbi:MAG: hypothetical protein GW775_00020 [Candidatus Magasanikbacteria bacterium]|nr:hypothetical protein [Candidatus Magasanikbacteria bacterium]
MNKTTKTLTAELISRATAVLGSTIFASLLALVEASFQVPQFGSYHN